ncbi:MAG TPA: class I SAM-dependent rRNA methyltransferase [Vicinamibacterales bacterium]
MQTRPLVVVSRHGVDRLRSGHPWVYRSDVVSSDADPGDLVRVLSERRRPLGIAWWSGASQIALRMLQGFQESEGSADERAMLDARLRTAIDDRTGLAIDATAFRLVHAEGDRLPGLIVDRYGDGERVWLVVQTLCQATDRRLAAFVDRLVEFTQPAGVLARNDPKVRLLEGLDLQVDVVYGDVPQRIDICEGPTTMRVDLRQGQKTGLFLDQRENHAAAAGYARGRVLDAFAYHGGFALAMARRAETVLAIESSASAVEVLRDNAARNGAANVEAREANVFDELRELEVSGARFETIVLDPPAFAKNRAAVDRAAAAYKEINLRALKLLAPGGHLLTCSCSHHVDEALFLAIVESAAADAHASVVLVERRLQARDHPVLLGVPETSYLKCLVLRRTG